MPAERTEILNELARIISIEARIDAPKIVESSRLYQDFGIAGDDVGDIFQRIVEKWGTDFSDFAGEKYSPTEQEIGNPFRMIASIFTDVRGQYRELTVGRLADAIVTGKWVEKTPWLVQLRGVSVTVLDCTPWLRHDNFGYRCHVLGSTDFGLRESGFGSPARSAVSRCCICWRWRRRWGRQAIDKTKNHSTINVSVVSVTVHLTGVCPGLAHCWP